MSMARLLLAASALAVASGAHADTLREALLRAYQTNPTLTGARSGQRAADETVPLQKAQGRPNASATGSYTESLLQPNNVNGADRTLSLGATVNVPIYSGGAVKNGIRAAESRIEAGRFDLRATEASIFSAVVAAYMDVLRFSAIVALNEKNVDVLEVNVRATNDRFEVGDLTRTDVAQSQARLAIARSDLQTARSNLIASKERYIALVGTPPGDLAPPPELPGLPANPDTAVDVAIRDNPDVLAAQKLVEAARFDVRIAGASRLPSVSAFTRGTYNNSLGSLGSTIPGGVDQDSFAASAGLSATIPIYQGGRPAAQVRQAQARESQALEREVAVERDVISQVRSSYASWQASLEVIRSSQTAVDAAALSLEGVRAENGVGTRTVLDILNAEQELLNAKVTLVSARRNAYVAAFTLIAAMGHGEAKDLALDGGALYDPVVNYERVRDRWWDWSDDPQPTTVATRTVDTPAQDAKVSPNAAP